MDEFTSLFESFDSLSTAEPPLHNDNSAGVSSTFGDIDDLPCDFERDTGGGGYYTYCVIA